MKYFVFFILFFIGTIHSSSSSSSHSPPLSPSLQQAIELLDEYEDWNLDDHIQQFNEFHLGKDRILFNDTNISDFIRLWKRAILEKRIQDALDIMNIDPFLFSILTEEDLPFLKFNGSFLINPFSIPNGHWLFINSTILIAIFKEKEKDFPFFDLSLPLPETFIDLLVDNLFSLLNFSYTSDLDNDFWKFITSLNVTRMIINSDNSFMNQYFYKLSIVHLYYQNIIDNKIFSEDEEGILMHKYTIATKTLNSLALSEAFHLNDYSFPKYRTIKFKKYSPASPFPCFSDFFSTFEIQYPLNSIINMQNIYFLNYFNTRNGPFDIIPSHKENIGDLSILNAYYSSSEDDENVNMDIVSLLYCISFNINTENISLYRKEFVFVLDIMSLDFLTHFELSVFKDSFSQIERIIFLVDSILTSGIMEDHLFLKNFVKSIERVIFDECSPFDIYQESFLNYLFNFENLLHMKMLTLSLFPKYFIDYILDIQDIDGDGDGDGDGNGDEDDEDDEEDFPESLDIGEGDNCNDIMIRTLDRSIKDLCNPRLLVSYKQAVDAGGPSRFWISSIWNFLSPFNAGILDRKIMDIDKDSCVYPALFVSSSCGTLLGLALQKSLLFGMCPPFKIGSSFLKTFLFASSIKMEDIDSFFFTHYGAEIESLRTTKYWGRTCHSYLHCTREDFLKNFEDSFEFCYQPKDIANIKFTSPYSDNNILNPPSISSLLMKKCTLEEMDEAFVALIELAKDEFFNFILQMRKSFNMIIKNGILALWPKDNTSTLLELFSPFVKDASYFKKIKNILVNSISVEHIHGDDLKKSQISLLISLFINVLNRKQLIRFIILWSGCRSISMIPWHISCPTLFISEFDVVGMQQRHCNLGFQEIISSSISPSMTATSLSSSSSSNVRLSRKRKIDDGADGADGDLSTVVNYREFKRIIEEMAIALKCESPFESARGRSLLFERGIWNIWYKTCFHTIDIPSIHDEWEILVHSLLASLNQSVNDMHDDGR